MIKSLHDAKINYICMFIFLTWLFAMCGVRGYFSFTLWFFSLVMVVELFKVALVIAETEEL